MNCPTNVESSQQTVTLVMTLPMQADCVSVSRREATALTDKLHAILNDKVEGVVTASWRSCDSIMEPMSNIWSYRKRSTSKEPNSVCQTSASRRSIRVRRQLQSAESDYSPSHSRSQSSSKESDSSEMEPTPQKKLVKCLFDSEISSLEKQSGARLLYMQRKYLKPPKFDSSTAFDWFLVQFHNCTTFNKWNKAEQLAFLRGTLDKEAAHVLWDYKLQS